MKSKPLLNVCLIRQIETITARSSATGQDISEVEKLFLQMGKIRNFKYKGIGKVYIENYEFLPFSKFFFNFAEVDLGVASSDFTLVFF